MKRLIAISVGLYLSGAALAADPVRARPQSAPAATLRTVGATDVAQPLPAAVSTALPPAGATDPALPVAVDCGPGCPGEDCASCGRTCLQKVCDWFCYRPGPRGLPLCTPVPYQAPLRHYFPCHPGECLVVGGCNPGAGCVSGISGQTYPDVISYYMPRPPITGPMPVPQAVPPVPAAPRPAAAPTPTPMPASQAVPPPAGAPQAQPPTRATRPTFRARVKGVFSSMWSDTVPFQTPDGIDGPTVVPAPNGLRFAAPGIQKPANGNPSGLSQAEYQQPSANRPLTRQ